MTEHRTTSRFRSCYQALQPGVRELADRAFARLRQDPSHPSLQFKKVGLFWSTRVGLGHRALAVKDETTFTWVWIGSHEEYDRLVSGR